MKTGTIICAVGTLSLLGCNLESTSPSELPALRLAQAGIIEKTIPFESFGFDCPGLPASSPGVTTVSGSTVHVRDIIGYGYHVSTVPLAEGLLTVWVDIQFNENGTFVYHGRLELAPTTLNGTGSWVGAFGAHARGNKFDGNPLSHIESHIVANGTGVLEGQSIKFDLMYNSDFAHPPAPAGCTFVGELFKGFIFTP